MMLTFLDELKDHRRLQGQRYKLKHIVLFSIMGILSNSKSYRDISRYIKKHYKKLNNEFDLGWKKPPAYTTIRSILQGLSQEELENCFRKYSKTLSEKQEQEYISVAVDGKVLRHSFDNFNDKGAVQILSFFNTDTSIILAHQKIDTKTNEIPVARELIIALDLEGVVYTFDALHCQKKLFELAESEEGEKKTLSSSKGQPKRIIE